MRFNSFLKRMMRKHGILREDAKLAVDLVVETLKDVLLEGEQVLIPRLGTFHPRYTKSREWVQPSSGELMTLRPRVRLTFKSTRHFDKMMTKALGDHDGQAEQALEAEDEEGYEADDLEGEADDGGAEEDA